MGSVSFGGTTYVVTKYSMGPETTKGMQMEAARSTGSNSRYST